MLFLFSLLTFYPSAIVEEKIAWDESRPLTWEDFRGVPNRADDFVASTNSGISFSFSMKETNGGMMIQYDVVCNFYPDLSWYRPEKVSQYILNHEQTHFDISELHARKLRRALANLPHNRAFKEGAEEVYNAIEVERRAMQTKYDSESDHSNIDEAEYAWRKFVAEQLALLDDWK